MLGLLLARTGIGVTVLEKHADFLRDFRGDTIHPSTMQVLDELGLLEKFLKLPHQQVHKLAAQFSDERITLATFSKLPVKAPFIAMIPQWDFLNFLANEAHRHENFQLLTRTEATGLLRVGGRITGAAAMGHDGEPLEVLAKLTIAADGRGSTLRADANLPLVDLGAPMDVLWFRLSRARHDTSETFGRFDAGRIFIMLNRSDYWQCAFVIPKGANEAIRRAGLEAFRASMRPLLQIDPSRADEIRDWEQVKLLTVQVNRLTKWWLPGFLCIGDAAHAMSPVGGVGINLAVQDAVAAANILATPIREGFVSDDVLVAVQTRREWPTRVTQRLQVVMQNSIIAGALSSTGQIKPPRILRLITSLPGLRRIPPRILGLGVQPEHVGPALRTA
jgi:2-polyprenyl-6-methoxyphenol hydroxylase-like FAD-dependent oxidoreductase